MNRSEFKSKIISLGLIKTKDEQQAFNDITGVTSFRHATVGIQMKNIKTDEDVIKAWNKYIECKRAWGRFDRKTKKTNIRWTDYSHLAYNNSADDL